jgi:xylan 1,4-beta-xylosidase
VPEAPVTVELNKLPAQRVMVTHYRIDQEYSNSYEAWKKMGSPKTPTPEQYAELERAGHLQMVGSPEWINTLNGNATIKMSLPRQGVSLLKIVW